VAVITTCGQPHFGAQPPDRTWRVAALALNQRYCPIPTVQGCGQVGSNLADFSATVNDRKRRFLVVRARPGKGHPTKDRIDVAAFRIGAATGR